MTYSLQPEQRPIFYTAKMVFTQSNASGGNIIADIAAREGSFIELLNMSVGNDNYASVRRIIVQTTFSGSRFLGLRDDNAVDNYHVYVPSAFQEFTQLDPAVLNRPIVLTANHVLTVEALSLAQNETLTVLLHMAIWGSEKPRVDVSGSNGTVASPSVTEAYD